MKNISLHPHEADTKPVSIADLERAVATLEKACGSLAGKEALTLGELHRTCLDIRIECESRRAERRKLLKPDTVAEALLKDGSAKTPERGTLRSGIQLEVKRLTKLIRRCGAVTAKIRKALNVQARIERIELDKDEAARLIKSPGYLERFGVSIQSKLTALPAKQLALSRSEKKGKVQQRAAAAIAPLFTTDEPDDSTLLTFVATVDPVLHVKVTKSPPAYRERFLSTLRTSVSELRKSQDSGEKKGEAAL